MQGVSFVALHVLLSIEDAIGDSSRQDLFGLLPEIAAATEENDRQRAGMAARMVCSEWASAALSATGRFADEATRLLEPDRPLDALCADLKAVQQRVQAILADMPLPYADEPPAPGGAAEIDPELQGPSGAEAGSNNGGDGDEDVVDLFPRTPSGIDHERLIVLGRALEGAIAAAEAVDHPELCTSAVKAALRFMAMIIDTEPYTDIARRSLRRILDVQTEA